MKGYRTIIIGLAIGIIGTIKAIATPEDAANAPDAESINKAFDSLEIVYAWGSAAAIWIIRVFTNTKIFKKE